MQDKAIIADFVQDFHDKNGRAPRILHIGNVGNYGYVTAKIMRAAGIDADVFDPDFYHIMATPEWHEADVTGDYGDDFYPQWSRVAVTVDQAPYKRPDWVIQGKRDLCLGLMAARHAGAGPLRRYCQMRMAFEQRLAALDFSPFWAWFWSTRTPAIRLLRGPYRRLQNACDRALTGLLTRPADRIQGAEDHGFLGEYHAIAPRIKAALAPYDLIIGYTVSAIYAAAIGCKTYGALELGTLRGLPYEASPMGRMTRWLYQNAPVVFVTNLDCLDHAEALGIGPDRRHAALHAYDLTLMSRPVGEGDAKVRRLLPHLTPDQTLLLAPARHHWQSGNASWLKGNDLYLRALGALKREGFDFHLVTVAWGQEVERSKHLIATEGLEDRVTWIKPQSRPIMKALYHRSAGVIDQFNAEAFGGVALDAMACAKRLVTRFDAQKCREFFTTPAPLASCATLEAVIGGLKEILLDPRDEAGRGRALQAWVQSENSEDRQLAILLRALQPLLAPSKTRHPPRSGVHPAEVPAEVHNTPRRRPVQPGHIG